MSISAKGSTVSKEERFRSAHGNEEDFFEMYRDDFDDDEEAEDAFYEEMEDDELRKHIELFQKEAVDFSVFSVFSE